MIKVLKNGKEKKFFTRCYECGSDLEYDLEDVATKDPTAVFPSKHIKCPECGSKVSISLQTREQFEWLHSFPGWNSCACSSEKI